MKFIIIKPYIILLIFNFLSPYMTTSFLFEGNLSSNSLDNNNENQDNKISNISINNQDFLLDKNKILSFKTIINHFTMEILLIYVFNIIFLIYGLLWNFFDKIQLFLFKKSNNYKLSKIFYLSLLIYFIFSIINFLLVYFIIKKNFFNSLSLFAVT